MKQVFTVKLINNEGNEGRFILFKTSQAKDEFLKSQSLTPSPHQYTDNGTFDVDSLIYNEIDDTTGLFIKESLLVDEHQNDTPETTTT